MFKHLNFTLLIFKAQVSVCYVLSFRVYDSPKVVSIKCLVFLNSRYSPVFRLSASQELTLSAQFSLHFSVPRS